MMRILHISDIHIGKRVNGFSMIDDQKYILNQIIGHVDNNNVDAIIIAGDIYDKPIPPAEAVELFDLFLTEIADRNIPVFIISGNHDSAERIAFGGKIMNNKGVYLSRVFDGVLQNYTLSDQYGDVEIYMLPFIKPAHVRPYFEDVSTYEDAVKCVIQNTAIDTTKRNILITHQFITNGTNEPERCESEVVSVGGTDNIDVAVFEDFDYVALGHLHAPQSIGRKTIRYSGSPLKYSFSECMHKKSITMIEVLEKGNITVHTIALEPKRDMREIKGNIENLIDCCEDTDDYIRAILTDEAEIIDAIGKLRAVYPNLMRIDFENRRSKAQFVRPIDCKDKSPIEHFAELYELQNGDEIDEQRRMIIKDIFESIGGQL